MAVVSKVYIFHLFCEQIWEIWTQSLTNGIMKTIYREKEKRLEQKDLLRRTWACNSEVIVNLENNVKEAPSLTMQKDYMNKEMKYFKHICLQEYILSAVPKSRL